MAQHGQTTLRKRDQVICQNLNKELSRFPGHRVLMVEMISKVITIFTVFLAASVYSSPALAGGKFANRVKLDVLDWAREVMEADLETKNEMGSESLSIEMKPPVLHDKSKFPKGIFEVQSIDFKIKFKDKSWDYTGTYFFDENCHRTKFAENAVGKEIERKMLEKKK